MASGPIRIYYTSTQKAYNLPQKINRTQNKHQLTHRNSYMIHIKDNIRTTRKMDSAYIDGKTEQSTKDNFSMTSSMVKGK